MRAPAVAVLLIVAGCGTAQDDGGGAEPTSGAGGSQPGSGGARPLGGGASGSSGGTSDTGGAAGTEGKSGTGGVTGTGGTGNGGSAGGGGSSGSGSTGGSSGAGGSTGTGGAPIGGGLPCSSLPAAGSWQSIRPSLVVGTDFGGGFSEAISVDPFDPAVVWLGTGANGIYKSTDCGTTFTHMNTGRNASAFDRGNHISMLVDPVDRGVIWVANIHYSANLWKSTNGGVDWDQVYGVGSQVTTISGGDADAISMDPTDHRHLMVEFHSNCIAPYDPACEAETTDGGATWRLIKLPTSGWEEGSGPWIINATTWLHAGGHLWRTTDRGATWTNLDPDPAAWWGFNAGEVETHSIPHAPGGGYYLGVNQGVVQSTDGLAWSLIPNSGPRTVGFVIGGGHLYGSDQWTPNVHSAPVGDPTHWSAMPAPAIPSGQGCPYLDFDPAHHVLFASCYAAGTWRMVVN
jgi:hypothetical protein